MANLALPQLFVKSSNSIFESIISTEEIINFHLTNKHKHAILTESQKITHFPSFCSQASKKNLIPVLSLHYIWDNSSEWLLIPKNFEGYKFLLQFTSDNLSEERDWINIFKIFISGDKERRPWKDQEFFVANVKSARGIFVRENLFLRKEDYSIFALVRAIKSEVSYQESLDLNSHLKDSYLIQKDLNQNVWKNNLVRILRECKAYPLNSLCEEIMNIENSSKRMEIINYCQDKLSKFITNLEEHLSQKYLDRLQREIDLFDSKKYWNYCFVFYELMKFIQHEKILTSAGRGSACSSLIIFLLGITQVDPLKYNLLFDRFLNESSERIPDLDLDVEGSRKSEILHFLEKRFGKNNFAIPSIIKRVKNVKTITPILEKILSSEEMEKKDFTDRLVGLPITSQPHPSSLIVLPKNMETSYLSVKSVENLSFPVTPFEYSIIGYLGLQKFDLLSSPYLDFISILLKKVGDIKSQDINLTRIPLDDPKTYKLISQSLTYGLFHLDSDVIKKILTKFKPNTIEELAQLIAIIRPGINKHISQFLNYPNSTSNNFLEDSQRKIIEPTRLIVLYQEQIMELISNYLQISLADSDKYRIALQKQQKPELERLKLEFFSLSKKQGKRDEKIEKIWNFIVSFGAYSFNKSHAIAYALCAYQSAYLKANFKEIFYLESMKKDGFSNIILSELKTLGYKILAPKQLEDWTLWGGFDNGQKNFFIGLNCLKQNSEIICKKLQDVKEKLRTLREKKLNSIIFTLLSNGFNKEEIINLNYLNSFQSYFSDSQSDSYLHFNWDHLLGKLIYGSASNEKEIKLFFTAKEIASYQKEKQKNLNIDLQRFKLN